MLLHLYSLLFLPLIHGQNQRQRENNPNNFELFENFELTKKIYLNETKLVTQLKHLRENLVQRQKLVRQILNLQKDCDNIDHPVEGFQLLKNVALELPKLHQEFQSLKPIQSYYDQMHQLAQEFPTRNDYNGASKGLIRLQFAYELDLQQLSDNGKISWRNSDNQTESFDCHERLTSIDFSTLAETAFSQKNVATAIDFAKEALRMVTSKVDEGVRSLTDFHLKRLKTMVRDLMKMNNGYLIKREIFLLKDFMVKPYLVNEKLERKKKQPKFVKNQTYRWSELGDSSFGQDWIFMSVCRHGRIAKFDIVKRELNCRFLHHSDPYLKLGPFKEEQKSERPYAVIFHDILSDLEMDYLVNTSRPNLSRSRYGSDDVQDVLGDYEFKQGNKVKIIHKTVQAWLSDVEFYHDRKNEIFFEVSLNQSQYPILAKLAKKIKLATQLEVNRPYSATKMQVTNYGLAGLCETHIDPHGYIEGKDLPPSRLDLIDSGDMIGTFMAWLKDVGAGGGTAYVVPAYEGIIQPEKGAAAFWYDLLSNSHRDTTTQHGGCPVLKGSKWILNKWMYSYDNFAKFPCGMESGQPIPAPDISHYY